MHARLDFYRASPQAIQAMRAQEAHISQCGLEKSLCELVRLRASQINGCAFCVDKHTVDARKNGESERRLAAVCVWRETPFFTDRERAALAWTEAVTQIAHDRADDALWDSVKPYFNEKEIFDLTLLISTINSWNRLAVAFRLMPT